MSYSSDDEYDFLESIERRNSIRYEAEKMLIQERNNKELQDLNAQIGEIDEKLKKLEEKFKDKKVGEFNGYRDLAMPTEQITQNGVVIKDEELSQNKKLLFEAVANGDLTQIDLYLEAPGLNLETTLYCENLLMCSIRNERQTMAEYLIVRGVNVDYEANLIEFNGNQPSPIKHVKYSCREMAYDHKMWKLVDLIDIFSQSTDKRIVKYISRRYVNELESFQPVETKPESLGNVKLLLAKQPQSNVDSKEGSIKEENEEELEKEIEYTKPPSRQGINDDSSEIAKIPLVITEEFVANKLREKIIEKVKSLVDVRHPETDGDKKCFLYNNFKVNLLMKRKDSVESTRLRNRGYSQTILDINSSKDVEIENIITLEENQTNKSKRGTKLSTDRKFSVDSVNKSKTKSNSEQPKVVDFIKIPVCESEDNKKYKNNRRKTVRF